MFKLLVISALVAVALGAADPKASVLTYGAAPLASYYTAPVSTVAAAAPVAYSAYTYPYASSVYGTPTTYQYAAPYAYSYPYYGAKSYYY